MNFTHLARSAVVAAMTVQALAAPRLHAENRSRPVPASAPILDVRLDPSNCLHLELRSEDGSPLPQRAVEIRPSQGHSVQVATDAAGAAKAQLTRGGVFLIAAGETGCVCRVWTHAAAPPSATDGVMLVENSQILRGNCTGWRLYDFYERRPVLAYTLTAAAIVVPIVLLGNDDDDAS